MREGETEGRRERRQENERESGRGRRLNGGVKVGSEVKLMALT